MSNVENKEINPTITQGDLSSSEKLPGQEMLENAMDTKVSRRGFLGALAGGAAALGLRSLGLKEASASPSTPISPSTTETSPQSTPISESLTQSNIEATATPDHTELPAGAERLMEGVYSYKSTERMKQAKEVKMQEYANNSGIPLDTIRNVAAGIEKGSIFLKGQDGRFYEFSADERGVYHFAGGKLQRVRILGDIAYGRIQLDEEGKNYFQLPSESLAVLESRLIAGEKGTFGGPDSDVPTVKQMMKKLTANGTNNIYGEDNSTLRKERTREKIDRNMNIGQLGSGLPDVIIGAYDENTKHNIPKDTLDFMNRKYGVNATEILGLPISEPYWMKLKLTNPQTGYQVETWVLWQAFERGTVTYNPQNPEEWKFEGGLPGNLFIATLNHGNENTNFMDEVGGPKRPENAEELLKETELIDRATHNLNGKNYVIEARETPSVSYRVDLKDSIKGEFVKVMAQDAEKKGYDHAEFVVISDINELPQGLALSSIYYTRDGKSNILGDMTSHKEGNKVIVYLAPKSDIIPDDTNLKETFGSINDMIGDLMARAMISGGNMRADVLRGRWDYINLIRDNALMFDYKDTPNR